MTKRTRPGPRIDAVGTRSPRRRASIGAGQGQGRDLSWARTGRMCSARRSSAAARAARSRCRASTSVADKIPLGAHEQGADDQDGPDARQRYLEAAAGKVETGEIDPSFVVTHRATLDEGPGALQDVPRQRGRLHQGRVEALTETFRTGESTDVARTHDPSRSSPAPPVASATSSPSNAPRMASTSWSPPMSRHQRCGRRLSCARW